MSRATFRAVLQENGTENGRFFLVMLRLMEQTTAGRGQHGTKVGEVYYHACGSSVMNTTGLPLTDTVGLRRMLQRFNGALECMSNEA